MNVKKLLLLIAAASILSSCSEDEISVFGGLYGVISDSVTGEFISGAQVIVSPGNQSTITSSDGHFEFKNLESRQYLVSVSADGYASNSRQVSVVPGDEVICSILMTKMDGAKLSQSYMYFDNQDIEKTLVLMRVGNEPVNWIVTNVPSWLNVYPEEGTISLNETSKVLNVVLNRENLGSVTSGGFMLIVNGVSNYVAVETGKNGSDGGENPSVGNVLNGLYGYYTFEDTTFNLVDGAPDAVGVNSPEFVDGVKGKGVKFSVSANSYLNFPEPIITPGKAFSISFWAKDLSDGHYFHLTDFGDHGDAGYILNMQNGKLGLFNGYEWIFNTGKLFSHTAFESGRWYMITVVGETASLQKAKVSLYIDGVLSDVIQYSSAVDLGHDPLSFVVGGNLEYRDSYRMNAAPVSIDNLRFYNSRALTSAEVKQIYNYEK